MEQAAVPPTRRRRLLAKFTGVALIGLAVSFAILHLGLAAGLRPWAARLIALLVAMHVTFLINGRFVFCTLTRERFLPLWGGYVANSAFGNSCNYAVFVGLSASGWPLVGHPDAAFLAGSLTAWTINFLGARFLVFGSLGRRLLARARRAVALSPSRPRAPASAEPAPSPRRAPSS